MPIFKYALWLLRETRHAKNLNPNELQNTSLNIPPKNKKTVVFPDWKYPLKLISLFHYPFLEVKNVIVFAIFPRNRHFYCCALPVRRPRYKRNIFFIEGNKAINYLLVDLWEEWNGFFLHFHVGFSKTWPKYNGLAPLPLALVTPPPRKSWIRHC